MRDLNEDLALCEAVTEVFYDEGGGYTASGGLYEKETEFFEQAPHGWPEAIRRAIAAEAESASLLRDVTMEAYGPICENCGGHRSVPPINEWGEGPDCPVCYGVGTLTRDVLYRKIDDLQTMLMDVYQKARNDVARWDGVQCMGLPVFQDRVYARRLVRDLQPLLFPV